MNGLGGATGIGRAAAKRYIEEGAFVFIFGRQQEALAAALAELGPNARAVKGSVSDEADLDRPHAAALRSTLRRPTRQVVEIQRRPSRRPEARAGRHAPAVNFVARVPIPDIRARLDLADHP